MRKILILGAGRSSFVLIKYLLEHAEQNNWFVRIADFSENLAQKVLGSSKHGDAISLDVNNKMQRENEIKKSDIVISMLPPNMHILVAEDCIAFRKNLVTASYVSDDIKKLDQKAKKAGIILLNEVGLDPGIDHMSAMKVIDQIKDASNELISFKSYCGGLIHPEFDNNPWNYKFTWNPRNVVLAGQGVAKYIENRDYKYIPYSRLFRHVDAVNILDAGEFEGYANRDSLAYKKSYGLQDIQTLFRGTLRRKGYCSSWDLLIQLGVTDDSYKIQDSIDMTYREFTNLFFPFDSKLTVEEKFCKYLAVSYDSDEFSRIKWLGLFSNERIELDNVSPAEILQKLLESKWSLSPEDKDMIVMQHQFIFHAKGELTRLNSSLVVYGEDSQRTAMAKTVGLPVAIATKLILNKIICLTGVRIPTEKDIYLPILEELEENKINFIEELV